MIIENSLFMGRQKIKFFWFSKILKKKTLREFIFNAEKT
jgi:hypothetical protein